MNPNYGKYSCAGIPGPRGPPGPPGPTTINLLQKNTTECKLPGEHLISFENQIIPNPSCSITSSVISNTGHNVFTISSPIDDCSVYNVKLVTQNCDGNLSISSNLRYNIEQSQKIIASDAAPDDQFGTSVAISGDYAIAGAPGDDDIGVDSGSAYIFYRNQGGADNWGQIAKLTASDAAAGDQFGTSVSISGDYAVVGAPFKDNGVDADSGSAYIFYRNQGGADNWGQVVKLTASDTAAGDQFGKSVSIDKCYIIVGSPFKNLGEEGSAYIFYQNQGGADNWGQIAKLTASDAAPGDQFGTSVSISGNYAIIGAPFNNVGSINSGSAYIFYQIYGMWYEITTLIVCDIFTDDRFGTSVSINKDYAIVGAPLQNGTGADSGSAYIFYRNQDGIDNSWGQVTKLTASDNDNGDQFGRSVSIWGEYAVVGSPFNDDVGSNSGSAYIFYRNQNEIADSWGELEKVLGNDIAAGNEFGWSVSISQGNTIIGSLKDSSAGSNSGSAYIFDSVQKTYKTNICCLESFSKDLYLYYTDVLPPNTVAELEFSKTINQVPGKAYSDPEVKIVPNDGVIGDQFGYSVSISGDYAIVGSPFDDDVGSNSGSVYIYYRNQGGIDNSWGQATKITASDGAADDRFGWSVSISGDYAIVGSPRHNVGGSPSSSNSGSAYILYRNQGGLDVWGEVTKITASDAAGGDQFGYSVSISGCYVIVGAPFKTNAFFPSVGATYIFYQNQGAVNIWGQVVKRTASDAAGGDQFGYSVSISGKYAVVGAPKNSDAGANSGSAYILYRNQGGTDNWGQVTKITASDAAAADEFGHSVSISGEYVVIGARYTDSSTGSLLTGSAYIFYRNQAGIVNSWGEVVKITASDAFGDLEFGTSVSIYGEYIIVGAPSLSAFLPGSVYIFYKNQGGVDNWGQITKIITNDARTDNQFGFSVSIDKNCAIAGLIGSDEFETPGVSYIFCSEKTCTSSTLDIQKLQ